MAPHKKKRKLSSAEKRKIKSEAGKKSAQKRGIGVGSRKKFILPANWKEKTSKTKKKRLLFESPGKTIYRTQNRVEEELRARNLTACLPCDTVSSQSSSQSEYLPSDFENMEESMTLSVCERCENCSCRTGTSASNTDTVVPSSDKFLKVEEIEQRLFICESTQIGDLIEQINATSKCCTKDCHGKLKSSVCCLSIKNATLALYSIQ